jgi:nucleoside-diphosphate-sugar epimerase
MMEWNNTEVLVTGGAGHIGANLVRRLIGLNASVTVADNLWRGKLANLSTPQGPLIDFDSQFHELDLIDYENCRRVVAGKRVVYHLADVVAGINYVFGNQLSLFSTNVVMNSNMLRAAIAAGVERYVYVGTACSYPAEKQNKLNPPPFKEEDVYPASPESSYGWSKLMGEYECQLAQKENLIQIGLLRFHNVYGPCCEMSPEKSQVIPALIRKALNFPREQFVVWGSGNQRRAFVFVEDVVDALVAVVEHGMNQGAIQIGPDRSESIADIAKAIVSLAKKEIPIQFDATKPEGDADRTADWSKAKRLLDWSPRTDIVAGLAITMQWCRERLAPAKQ